MDRDSARPMSTLRMLALVVPGLGCALQYTVPLDEQPIECEPGLLACGERCIATDDDDDHCGGCGQACAAGKTCEQGECVDPCGVLDSCDDTCVDFQVDPANCGDCDSWCDASQSCVAGECVSSCGVCDSDEQCVSGACACRAGFVACADDDDDDGGVELDCVDLQTDDQNCGECDRQCDDLPCGAGECQPADCPGFPDRCDDACTDVRIDPLNCGECDNECHPSQSCVDGACVSPS